VSERDGQNHPPLAVERMLKRSNKHSCPSRRRPCGPPTH
jgi:hypothetical protein